MASLRIEGGRRLSGQVSVEGNKNSALPLLVACLLTEEECVLENVPRIRDVEVLIELMRGLGATVDGVGTSTIKVRCPSITTDRPDAVLVGKLRGSVLLLGPLLGRYGSARLAQPGGDFPARRTIATHLQALECDGSCGARRARSRSRRSERAQRRVDVSRRSFRHRHRDGASCRRSGPRLHGDPPCRHGTSRRRAVFVSPRHGSVDRRGGHDDDPCRGAQAMPRRAPQAGRGLHRGWQLGRRRGDHRWRHSGDRRARRGHRGRCRTTREHGAAVRVRRRPVHRRNVVAHRNPPVDDRAVARLSERHGQPRHGARHTGGRADSRARLAVRVAALRARAAQRHARGSLSLRSSPHHRQRSDHDFEVGCWMLAICARAWRSSRRRWRRKGRAG